MRDLAEAPILARWQGPMRPHDLAITILGDYQRRGGGSVWSGGMVEVICEFGHSTSAARAALARLVRRGFLERHRHGRWISYVLTPRAQHQLAEEDRRMSTFGRTTPGDIWTFLWHAIPEDRRPERMLLAPRLRRFGFGPLQDAVWIAASDRAQEARALIAELEIEAYASIFVAQTVQAAEAVILNSGTWELGPLRGRYDAFISNYSPYVEPGAIGNLTPREAFICRVLMVQNFRGFLYIDPELADSIMPLAAERKDAVAIFDALYTGLAPAAEQHFAKVALSPAVTERSAREL
jgi:phenylacetic acid degradation operon negative regulatory protein